MNLELSNVQPMPDPLADQPGFAVPAVLEAEIDEVITHYPKKRSAVLMLLHAHAGALRLLSRAKLEMDRAARNSRCSPINVYELVTFYPCIHQRKVGRRPCARVRTLSCALGGSLSLHEHFCKKRV